jgi:F1F0 ATPase subunit 2
MMLTEAFRLVLATVTGGLLGVIFFGGLWWTVRKGSSSQQPALWFFCSLLLRTSTALVGFYLVGRSHWERVLVCLLGFVMARHILIRLTRGAEKPTCFAQAAPHAP